MRVMLDTNVLLSALLFPSERMNRMLQCIFERHRLVLSSFVVEELALVVQRKFPTKAKAVDALLASMSFELVYTPKEMEADLFEIRDQKDYPVLYTAIVEDVDVLVTGDKDFSEVDVERPEILTPAFYGTVSVKMIVRLIVSPLVTHLNGKQALRCVSQKRLFSVSASSPTYELVSRQSVCADAVCIILRCHMDCPQHWVCSWISSSTSAITPALPPHTATPSSQYLSKKPGPISMEKRA